MTDKPIRHINGFRFTDLFFLFSFVCAASVFNTGCGKGQSEGGIWQPCYPDNTCNAPYICKNNICEPDVCEPDCTEIECGPDPVCGESCGVCETGHECENGLCVPEACEPDCTDIECGPDPVCGESCGICEDSFECVQAQCIPENCEPDCSETECGPDPVCSLNCGNCEDTFECIQGQCIPENCEPDCSEIECGPDPECGLICDNCDDGYICEDGLCISEAAETWTDTASGLVWQRMTSEDLLNHEDAIAYCEELDLDGENWRLPDISELRSLIRGCSATETGGSCNIGDDCMRWDCRDGSCGGCSLNQGPAEGCYWPDFLDGDCESYWSSSPVEGSDITAWNIHFSLANINRYYKVEAVLFARCVR